MESVYTIFLVAFGNSIIYFIQFIVAGTGPFYDPKIYWPTFIGSDNFTKEYYTQVTKMMSVPIITNKN